MRAYKFKGCRDMEHVFDILFKNRLYCADWTRLNDPLEGVYSYTYMDMNEDEVRSIQRLISSAKKPLRVCSLCETFDSHLLWAHYADGFSGVAIEVELPDDDPDVVQVQYRGVFASLTEQEGLNPTAAARAILASKYEAWSYEREVRILSTKEHYRLRAPIRRVIAGHRMSPGLFAALQIVCEQHEIDLCRTGIGDEGIDADYVPPSRVGMRTRRATY